MKIILHGHLAKTYGTEHYIEGSIPLEALEGLTRQLGFYQDRLVEDRPILRVVGLHTYESLLEPTDEIHVVPAIAGGKGIGKILVGAAFIGLAFLPGLGQIGQVTLKSVFLSIGASLVLGGLMELFIKAPSLSKSSDPEASKYLGLSNNTTKLGTLRSYSMGRIKLTAPHLLALNVDSNDLVIGEFPT